MRRKIAALCLIPLAALAAAPGLRLIWEPSASTDVVDYRVYRGPAPGNYNHVTNVGRADTNFSLVGLPEGEFTFVVTAVSAAGLESDPSNTAGWTNRRPAAPRLGPPEARP